MLSSLYAQPLPRRYIAVAETALAVPAKFLCCLSPPTAFALAMYYVARLEQASASEPRAAWDRGLVSSENC